MKIPIALISILLTGCASPRPPLPDIDNDIAVYDVDLSIVRILNQPYFNSYPPEAIEKKVEGVVIVQITIDKSGKPISSKAIDGPVLLRASAKEFAMRWQFKPTIIDKHPRNVRFKLFLPFRLGKKNR